MKKNSVFAFFFFWMCVSVLVASCVSDDFHISYAYRALENEACSFPERKSISSASGWSEILGITFMI